MALKSIAICAVGVLSVASIDARLYDANSPMKPRNAAAQESENFIGNVTSTVTLSPVEFAQNLFETAYLSKLLLAAQNGFTVPMQSKRPTNPIDLINNAPFPFNIVTEGLKRAATLAGVDLDQYRKQIEDRYQGKVESMIEHGIIAPEIINSVRNLDIQSMMKLIPTFDDEMFEGLRAYLPAELATIPSMHEIMDAFQIPAGSPAETTLRTLFPFFNLDALRKGMENGQFREAQPSADPVSLWVPFIDTSSVRQYFDNLVSNPLGTFSLGLPAQLGDLSKLLQFPSPA